MKTIIVFLSLLNFISAQTYEVEKIKGEVKYISSEQNNWQKVKTISSVSDNSIVSADINSVANIKGDGLSFTLKDGAAINVSSLKKMSIDQLIMALALDKVMSAPRKKENNKSESTSVYGDKLGAANEIIQTNDFGIKRINGAKQLAENGFVESAIVSAKEIFRKYPEVAKDAANRIYFADLLYNKKLYDEALEEYNAIKMLNISEAQKKEIDNKISLINKILLKN